MKILWVSNAAWANTGYGQQTALMLPRLRDAGHDVAVFCNYGLQGAVTQWEGFRHYPSGYDPYGNDLVNAWAEDWFDGKPGQIITFYDAWTFDPKVYKYPTASWVPIDHSPVTPRVMHWFEESGATPICYSRFGEEALAVNGLEPKYAPHALDLNIYSPRDRQLARRFADCPEDAFLVGMVAANKGVQPSRKCFAEAFTAFKAFREVVPEAKLYVHSEMFGAKGVGLNLSALAAQCEINTEDLWFPNQDRIWKGDITPEEMAHTYSAFDVLLAPSLGEGFGLPVLESQACGTPVIVCNGSAQRELCGSGWLIETQPFYDGGQGSFFHQPILRSLVEQLAFAYQARGDQKVRDAARAFAMQYDADAVFDEYWLPILKELEARLPTDEPVLR